MSCVKAARATRSRGSRPQCATPTSTFVRGTIGRFCVEPAVCPAASTALASSTRTEGGGRQVCGGQHGSRALLCGCAPVACWNEAIDGWVESASAAAALPAHVYGESRFLADFGFCASEMRAGICDVSRVSNLFRIDAQQHVYHPSNGLSSRSAGTNAAGLGADPSAFLLCNAG